MRKDWPSRDGKTVGTKTRIGLAFAHDTDSFARVSRRPIENLDLPVIAYSSTGDLLREDRQCLLVRQTFLDGARSSALSFIAPTKLILHPTTTIIRRKTVGGAVPDPYRVPQGGTHGHRSSRFSIIGSDGMLGI
jgi:hypothetical protein